MKKRGRPSKYKEEFTEQARKLCLLGATDAELAEFFDVSEATLNTWKKEHPDFLESLKDGKLLADATIADSLYQRAKGYSHKAVKIMVVAGVVEQVEYIEHYPPDPTSMIFWLKNRQPKRWRDKQQDGDAPQSAADVLRELADRLPD